MSQYDLPKYLLKRAESVLPSVESDLQRQIVERVSNLKIPEAVIVGSAALALYGISLLIDTEQKEPQQRPNDVDLVVPSRVFDSLDIYRRTPSGLAIDANTNINITRMSQTLSVDTPPGDLPVDIIRYPDLTAIERMFGRKQKFLNMYHEVNFEGAEADSPVRVSVLPNLIRRLQTRAKIESYGPPELHGPLRKAAQDLVSVREALENPKDTN